MGKVRKPQSGAIPNPYYYPPKENERPNPRYTRPGYEERLAARQRQSCPAKPATPRIKGPSHPAGGK